MEFADRLAAAAMRGIVEDLEADPALVVHLLGRLFSRDPAPAVPAPAPIALLTQPVPAQPIPSTAQSKKPSISEAGRLTAELTKRLGGSAPAARVLKVSPKTVRKWLAGSAVSAAHLDLLRGAVQGLVAPPNGTRPVPSAPPAAVTEAAELVRRLVAQHGGNHQAVADRFGFHARVLVRWENGGHCSPTTVDRLRQAAQNPPPADVAAWKNGAREVAGHEPFRSRV